MDDLTEVDELGHIDWIVVELPAAGSTVRSRRPSQISWTAT
jgi:hypothetical protein